jgi:hypothetical protein
MTYLSDRHLGKQRVEGMQIVSALVYKTGWKNHPAAKMWKGYEYALMYYVNCCIDEWVKRGRNNNMEKYELPRKIKFPWWIRWDKLHRSHRALLNKKDPLHYNFEYDPEFDKIGYIWPTDEMYEHRHLSIRKLGLPLTDRLLHAKYCKATLVSGVNKGKRCSRLLQLHDEGKLCGVHSRMKR